MRTWRVSFRQNKVQERVMPRTADPLQSDSRFSPFWKRKENSEQRIWSSPDSLIQPFSPFPLAWPGLRAGELKDLLKKKIQIRLKSSTPRCSPSPGHQCVTFIWEGQGCVWRAPSTSFLSQRGSQNSLRVVRLGICGANYIDAFGQWV